MNFKKRLPKLRMTVQLSAMVLIALGILYGLPFAKGAFIIAAIFMGPVFCGWVCHFGAMQDILAKIGRYLKIKSRFLPERIRLLMMPLRYILLAVTLLTSASFILNIFTFDPRSNFESFLLGNSIAYFGWAVIAAFLGLSLFHDRPFCSTLCIEGAKYGALSLVRPLTIVRNADACVQCGKCDASCPMQIDISHNDAVQSPQCIDCMNCISACPKNDALSFSLKQKKKKPATLVASLLIVAALFVSSLGSFTASTDMTVSLADTVSGTEDITSGDASGVLDGVYTGTGTGYRGNITINVTVEDELITEVALVSSSDDSRWLNRAYSTVVSEILSEQTAGVDTASGATYSSVGIEEAVANALIDAGSTVAEAIESDLPAASEHTHGKGRSF
ncbi:MAG: hypothetical protein PWQ12_745 [Clostridiales bacterium]|jgi:uncharacterized protein with FMN-binding domain|nr:hypothetical protein [Clostridiales bacterium]